MNATRADELVFETPRRNQGQIMTVSTAKTRAGVVIEQYHDASEDSLHYYWQRTNKRLSAVALARYGLIKHD